MATEHPCPFRIALTGGIASGKTTVAERFAARGIPIIDTDQIAREIVQPGQPALAQVVSEFGPSVLGPDGGLDRPRLRAHVFEDQSARKRLEAILHPTILEKMEARSRTAGGPYQIVIVPLLIETGLVEQFDRVLLVDCPEPIQIARLAERDAMDATAAQRILDAQASRAQRLAHADDVICNDADLVSLDRQVDALHGRYLKLCAQASP